MQSINPYFSGIKISYNLFERTLTVEDNPELGPEFNIILNRKGNKRYLDHKYDIGYQGYKSVNILKNALEKALKDKAIWGETLYNSILNTFKGNLKIDEMPHLKLTYTPKR